MKRNKKSLSCLVLLCFIFSLVSICAESASVVAAPIGEWHFDEGSGTVASDSSGRGKDGAITGAQWVEGLLNQALRFAGTADYVKVAPSIGGLSNWSLSAYIKPTGADEACVYSEKMPDLNLYIRITPNNAIRVGTWHDLREGNWDSYYTDDNVISRGEWNHLVVSLENGDVKTGSGTVRCYVNGVRVGMGKLGSSFLGRGTIGASWTEASSSTSMTRHGDSTNKKPGADFDSIYPWSGIKLCNVADDGTINATIDDGESFKWDGTNGQVMVKIPKFYYKHTYDDSRHGFFVAEKPTAGFKLHPAFSRNGVEKPYVLVGAYEAGISDNKLISRTGVSPAVSKTRAQFRDLAQARGTTGGWSLLDIQTYHAIQWLYLIEYANTNCQTVIGAGRTNASNAATTGGCDSLAGVSGQVGDIVSYRGMENLWGSVWEFIDGINIKTSGRQPYIAESGFVDNKFDGNYQPTYISLPAGSGYCKTLAYSQAVDWLLLPGAVGGNESTYIPDYFYQNWGAAADKVALVGGDWSNGTKAGLFYWYVSYSSTNSYSDSGARVLYIPQ